MIRLPMTEIDRTKPGPLFLKVKEEILRQIRLGGLRPGDRLPPTRQLATELGLNRGTVSVAYEQLVDEGVLESHVGRGTYVATELTMDALGISNGASSEYKWVDHFAGIDPPPPNLYPQVNGNLIPFHRNVPDEALFPIDTFRVSLDESLSIEGERLLSYAPKAGHPKFVSFLIDYLAENRLGGVSQNEVLVVNGSQQALDLIGRAFLRPGDTVVVENPSYSGALELFRSFGARIIGVDMDEFGLRIDEAEKILARERPKFIYTMPTFQNPTGRNLASARREQLVRLAARYEVPVIEDDFDGELFYDNPPPPTLKSLPGNQGVIYIGTPSKMLFPGLRIGWIVAEDAVVEHLGRVKQIADLSSSQLLQAAFARFAQSGALSKHKDRVRRAYKERRDQLLQSLEKRMPEGCSWSRPGGGMSLLVSLPSHLRADRVLEITADQGVLFSPGSWFFVNRGHHHLRLCFGSVPVEQIDTGVKVLADAVKRELRDRRAVALGKPSSLPQV
ncbi:MAG: PLP-dependent aminotransferase family protein [Candidatus Eisenbacteria bacterium]|uniref:PLP-dependent aminotransferase family protein n=1 Tax=Eiseniibacteriota bacterium TaxID=2212470 RepID=A0A7Y2EBV8_UNCEI|nr:PLP-dependent aminotransferase family protein [Candidatus Eisenbacteria bacterium]